MKLPLRPAAEILGACRTNVVDVDGSASHVDIHFVAEMLANPKGFKIWRCGSLAYEALLRMNRSAPVIDGRDLIVLEEGFSDVILIDDQEAELPRDERFCAVVRNFRRPELAR